MKTSLIVIALLSIFVCAERVPLNRTIHHEWELFKATYNKSYRTEEEELKRLQIFLDNKDFVTEHNKLYAQGNVTYTVGLNQFADWTEKEIKDSLHNCIKYPRGDEFRFQNSSARLQEEEKYDDDVDDDQPDEEVNWVEKGAVTSVKKQGHCGSCYIFSASGDQISNPQSFHKNRLDKIGALEGQYFLKTGTLVDLSAQDILDCDGKNDGCKGGFPTEVFNFIKSSKGVEKMEDYPYKARRGKCRYDPTLAVAKCTGYKLGHEGCEKCLKKMVKKEGPVSVGIYSKGPGFVSYQSGIYQSSYCFGDEIDHALLAVGYGTDEETGLDYWLLKNSWGTNWGEEGYVKLARNMDNMCGIANLVSIPTM